MTKNLQKNSENIKNNFFKTAMVFGTFDLFHKGHEFYIREAKKLAKNLIVIIARDSRVLSGKGFSPNHNEAIRRENVENFLNKNLQKNGEITENLKRIFKKFSKKKLSKTKNLQKSGIFILETKISQKKSLNSIGNLAILGDEKNIFAPIEKYKPEILAFGYDQKVPEEILKEKFPKITTIRIESFKPEKYKSTILREKLTKNCKKNKSLI